LKPRVSLSALTDSAFFGHLSRESKSLSKELPSFRRIFFLPPKTKDSSSIAMSSVLYLSGQKNEHWFLLPCLPVLFNHFFFSSSSFLYSSSFSYLLVTLRDRQNFPVYFGFSFPFIYHLITNSFFFKKKKKTSHYK
jgi:hypothetical protein